MTKEDLTLLMNELCRRSCYGVMVQLKNEYKDGALEDRYISNVDDFVQLLKAHSITAVRPYLIPMAKMSDEQYEKYRELCDSWRPKHNIYDSIDYLDEQRIDYRHFIEKGLAIDSSGLGIY
jgi:hypothetical protein